MLTFRGLDGAELEQLRLPIAAGGCDVTAPDWPSTVQVSLDLAGAGRIDKLWLRIDPVLVDQAARGHPAAAMPFDPEHYAAQLDRAADDPVAHYLAEGEAGGLSPHSWFDPTWYRDTYMTPGGRGGPALLDYAERAPREPVRPHPLFDAEWYARHYECSDGVAPLDDFLSRQDRAASLAALIAADVGPGDPAPIERPEGLRPHRISYHAPHLVEDATVATAPPRPSDLRITVLGLAATPEAGERLSAVIAAQTHAPTDLAIVDVGEDRAGALNAALDAVTSDAVAFLDSDSDWRPDHLARLAGRLQSGGGDAVFASWKRIEPSGRERWLGQPYDADAHALQDMLPLSAWLHRPSSVRFDGDAGLAMDWRYGRDLAAVLGPPAWSPVSTLERHQPADPGQDHRLAEINRRLDWSPDDPKQLAPPVSLVMVLQGRFTLAQETLAALLTTSASVGYEIVLVDNGVTERDLPLVIDWTRRFDPVRLVRAPQPIRAAVGANLGALAAHGEVLVFVAPGLRPRPGWLEPLVEALDGHSSVQPVLLSPDGLERSRGLASDAGVVVASTEEVIATRATDFRAVKGFDALLTDGPMAADLTLRLTAHTDRGFDLVEASVAEVASERALSLAVNVEAESRFSARWGELTPAVSRVPFRIGFGEAARDSSPLKIALKVCFANEPEANSGDWHFARSLAEALRAETCRVRIDGALDWYGSPEIDDVVLMLRGRWRYRPSPRHLNLMWLISHPDAVRPREVLGYDHVFAASAPLAERLAAGVARFDPSDQARVSPLLQCTDPALFHPPETDPPSRGVVFVANSRGVERRIAHQAVEERLPVEIHGRQWDRFAANALVRGPGMANAEVADLYRRSVVLNDHWADMRANGILSNRLFDAAACGAPVISDDVAGLDETFQGLVDTWRSRQALAPLVHAAVTEDAEARARRRALAQEVMAVHSFAARAREIVAVARRELARLAAEPNRRERAD
ncbi:glycosyltransferase [Brevundimonas lutea]|uniref:glycosyltransferase n=1 Tax=Brevundimonas lutea TaxID=2293980 RepID=UPI000F036EDD|nr:glycosyltransferase [Brevundimonas lutea]